jgi:hypothetical protein
MISPEIFVADIQLLTNYNFICLNKYIKTALTLHNESKKFNT